MIKHNWLWVVMTLGCGIVMGVVFLLEPLRAIKLGALLGTGLLGLTLVPNNSVVFVPQDLLEVKKILAWLIARRRDFGITSGLVLILHALLAWLTFGENKLSIFFTQPIIFGGIGIIIFTLLLATSSDYSLLVLKQKWKTIHNLIWVAIPFLLIHSLLAASVYSGEYSKIGILGFGGLIGLVIVEAGLKRHLSRHLRLVLLGTVLAAALFMVYPVGR